MRKNRFSEVQVIAVLKESEDGVETGELRDHAGPFYRWRSKLGGLELSVAKRLQQLEEENQELVARGSAGLPDYRGDHCWLVNPTGWTHLQNRWDGCF